MNMAIPVKCDGCGIIFSVDEKYVGKIGKCAKCGNRIPIVAPSVSEGEEEPSVTNIEMPPLPQKPNRSPRPATTKQKAFAEDLGIEFDEKITSREMSKLIDAALARQDNVDCGEVQIESHLKTLNKCHPSDMVEAMQKKGMCAFMFHWDPCETQSCGELTVRIAFSDNLTEKQVHKMIIRHVMELSVRHKVANLPDLFRIYQDSE
jgi:hypothetical protein